MRRSYKFLARPTAGQQVALVACLGDHRVLYNGALEHRRTAYQRGGVSIRYGDQSAELKHIRADDPAGQGRWSFSSQQATLRRLDKAFAAFFGRVRTGGKPGYPRFKGRGWFDALGLVRDHDLICHEDLKISNMTRSAGGTVEVPGRNVAQKAGLNRSILDAGWGVFLAVLAHKAESAGRKLIAVDPRNTSRTCSACGHCAAENRVTQAVFRCVACRYTAHADINAAINILRAGLALQATHTA